jgi:division/cell wall cluster transcriptional repressor MraZ
VARFFGRYEHSLDDKGRVILPAKFRGQFEHGGYLTEYQDGCLSLWTPDEFELQMESMLQRANSGRSDRNLVRLWASTSHELEIDRQGRMAIPARLREYAGLVGGRAGARGDRPGRAVESGVVGREGPARGGTSHPRRRRLSDAVRLHPPVRHGLRWRGPRVALVPAATPSSPRRQPRTTASVDRFRNGSDGVQGSDPDGGSRPDQQASLPGEPPFTEDQARRRGRATSSPLPGSPAATVGPRRTSRGWPRWPARTCTSNASGPCAVPRPDRWGNPPPPTPGASVAALHPLASCRSRDCG